ncbi:GTPase IMAP family member 8-like [Gigantopelta aegis]|uniref:GTPase IMAP family member 8-like n=1 Tax=Gigantopelta aegis TaxID=1735272 RepID=UPI001B88940D|nr:GTPase IMAP family member 8-like [Gigantopelta aegis]
MILLGKSGHGKSASGNSILGNNLFECGSSENPTTMTVQQEVVELNHRRVTVIDTPDPSRLSSKDVHELIKLNSVMMLVIRCGTRMTKDEWAAVRRLRTIFGHDAFRERGIILLTHCDLFPLARIQKDTTFLDPKLLEEFDNRVVFLTNKEENHLVQVTQIDDVMILVDDVLAKESHLHNKKQKTFLCCWSRNRSYALSS